MTIPQGTKLGRYEIRSLLGAGGMGEVYLADDLNLHRRVAVKVLSADLTTNRDRLQRFKREAYAASSLNHPNILTVHEFGSENENHFIVTEFVDGESLGQHLRRAPFQLNEVLEIGIQVASALAAAHAAGIVHRDIKPDNIMLRRDNLVKVLDFGLAKLSEPELSTNTEVQSQALPLTTPGVVMGTARYMSPEQARGLPVDARTDIWSLGVVLYEMVTRHAPFTGKTMSDVIVAVLSTHPPLLTTYRTDVPAELERIITKALRKDEEERYQLAKDLGLDLKTLKQRLEFETELERSGEGRRGGEGRRIVTSPEHAQTAETLVAEPKDNAAGQLHAVSGAVSESDLEAGQTRVKRDTDPQRAFTVPAEGETGFTTPAARAISNIGRLASFARQQWKALAAVAVFGVVALAAFGIYWRLHTSVKLTDKDTIVLADFTNTTGDAVFDGTLRQGLASQLEQSPFLAMVSDDHIAQTLALMTKPKDSRLTDQLARDVCQRTGSKATIEGSMSGIGGPYTLGLKAVDCRSGAVLADVKEKADAREQVIPALGKAAAKLRDELGESLASVQKYDVPAQNVTTSSLEALQAYSLGSTAWHVNADFKGAIASFERAVSLDPNFAMAYRALAVNNQNIGESARAAEFARRAYELRQRVSERERFAIESAYETNVTENYEAARKVYELWAQAYPRDDVPASTLGGIYAAQGDLEKSLAARQESLRLDPGNVVGYSNLMFSYIVLNRLDEAKATIQEAQNHSLDSLLLTIGLYQISFLQQDTAGMERAAALLISKPGGAPIALSLDSDTAVYRGQMSRARELTRRAVEDVKRAGNNYRAATFLAQAALREAVVGNLDLAKRQAEEARSLSDIKYIQGLVAITFGLAGDSAKATRIADDLAQRYPESTIIQFHSLPMIRAAIAARGANAANALEESAGAATYELGNLYLAYLRGQAYLAAGQGTQAAAKFQKILDHPDLVMNQSIGALAHLGLGRAYVMTGDTAKAKTAYQDFFALWKNADPDIPILKEARAEYEKLK